MSQNVRLLQTVAFGAVLVWGVWSLILIAIGAAAALIAVVHYGLSAFSVPSWALGLGACATMVALGSGALLRSDAKAKFLRSAVLVAKLAAVLFVAVGASAAIVGNLPELPISAADNQARLVAVAEDGLAGLWTIYAWLGLVAMPCGLAGIALVQFWEGRQPTTSAEAGAGTGDLAMKPSKVEDAERIPPSKPQMP